MPAGSYSTDELSSFSPTILRLFVSQAEWVLSSSLYTSKRQILNEKKTLKNQRRPDMPAGSYSTDDLGSFSPTIRRLFVSKAGWVISSSLYLQETILNEKKTLDQRRPYMVVLIRLKNWAHFLLQYSVCV
jgi:hypothetical protein